MTARYTLNTKTFIAPLLLEAGTVIEYDGEPGPHMDPMNDEANTALDAYFTKKPEARLTPEEHVEQAAPTLAVVSAPSDADAPAGIVSLADPSAKATAGLTDGGSAK